MEVNEEIKIDEDLYSRQIIFLGMETMEKISQLKIFIIGLTGLGVEIAKDIIVSGPNKLTIFDPNEVKIKDLGSNFYLSEKDIGKRRDKACLEKLQKLNKYVKVDYIKDITNINKIQDLKDIILDNYNVIVVSEIISKENILFLDSISRENNICLIYSVVFGLSSFVFTDFGRFTIYDKYCLKKRKFFIKKIERSKEGLVEIEWNKNRYPHISQYVFFKDVEGMNEINYSETNKKIFKIKPKSNKEFYIGNTLNYSEYKSGGYIEETVLPETIYYESFINKLENPFDENDFVNHKKKFIFLVFRALMEFFDSKERLPLPRNEEDYEELKIITKTIFDNLNSDSFKSNKSRKEINFDENIIKNISFTCSAEIPCITSLIGGIVCQEIIKTTGKMNPINQFKVYDFLQYSTIIPDSTKDCNEDVETKYNDLISIFGKKVVEKIRNLNILLAGAGALGCELLKNLALLGISNSVLVIDDDNIEISNLNRQFLFHEEHKGLSKSEIACNSAKEINSDLKCNYLSKRIEPKNKSIFNKSYFENVDFVLGAIDSQKGNYYLVKQCELFEKIFIKGGTKGAQGKVEIFIPNLTRSYNDLEHIEEIEEKSPSCTRRQFPSKIEDCIDNARDIFDEYFMTIFVDFLLIMDEKNDIKKEELSIEKYNLINEIISFIKINNNIEMENKLIRFGLQEYHKLFVEEILNIYNLYPLNDTEESKQFWNSKRIPIELKFDLTDILCVNFVFYFIKIFTTVLGIDTNVTKNISVFKGKLTQILNDKNIYNVKESLTNIDNCYQKLILNKKDILNDSETLAKIKKIKFINFEKDIMELGHIQFVHSLANLKAKSYKIPCCDKFYTLEYVGKIAPTTITSTAIVGGFMCLQIFGIIINQMFYWNKKKSLIENDDIDDEELIDNGLHNLLFNLKRNDFSFEPLYSEKYYDTWTINGLIPNKFSRWYKLIEKGNMTIEEFINYIKEKYGVEISLILSAEDDRNIYEKINLKQKNKKKLQKIKEENDKIKNSKLEYVYFHTAKSICKNYDKNNDIFLKIMGYSNNGDYIELPVIKIEN